MKNEQNCILKAEMNGQFINFTISVGDCKGVKVRLITPNRKLAYKIYCAVNGVTKNEDTK